jgi:hypothetical protein
MTLKSETIVYRHAYFYIVKRVNSAGDKRYTPVIDNKMTRISWTTSGMARLYGEAVALRLRKKRLVALQSVISKPQEKE